MAVATKDLTKLVAGRGDADQIYRLTCELHNLHAVQGRNDGLTSLSHQSVNETKDTTNTEGVPTGENASPQARRRKREQTTERQVPTYRFERNGKPDTILLQVGGPYGLFGKALRDAVVFKEKGKYWLPSMSLIKFRSPSGDPEYVEIKTETTISARPGVLLLYGKPGRNEDTRLEVRNGRGGRVMVPVFHERLFNKPIKLDVEMVVNSECPRTAEEIAGLLHAMQGSPFGPARRGELKITKVTRVA